MDVNLLPDELKKREEEELRRKLKEPIEVPMSSPIKDATDKQRHLSVPASNAPSAKAEEPKLPHLREESYLHKVTPEGKIIHEAKRAAAPLVRSGLPWWRRLLNFFRTPVRRVVVSPAPKGGPISPSALPSSIPPKPAVVKESTPTPPPVPGRAPGVAIEKATPPIYPFASDALVKQPAIPEPAKIATPPAPASVPAIAIVSALRPLAKEAPTAPPVTIKPGDTKVTATPLGPPPFGINLLPPDWSWNLSVTAQFRRRVLLALVIIFVVSLLGSYIGSYFFVSYKKQRLGEFQTAKQTIESDIAKYQLKEAEWAKLNSRLKLIAALLREHVMVTPVFAFLEETVSPLVQYTSASFTNDGAIAVTAETVSYEEMAKQVLALRADQARVAKVDISSFDFDQGKQIVTFGLKISLKPEVWHYGKF
ncbi:hypothetical protein A3H10_01820 [Candidatus Uhrbacteria bacterium RIFCSPLOWO2_12_FULL_46_10]|uniref:Uncharacterized protein n=1 Tax=Candidatus Uhrbacteria bacterium RIFCSPLOWO2_01_FULL_47_25 TaxID=1802402 RepID=A0A1F7UT21_9BACT|nr:MAG: hypothetical protein A2752_03310 [Candidatus Uhrbacteria bacterium RIFCSPHIGHO2_01_FULL_46_23]OGL69546.1 MAG: hypothetical protein A3D60_00905 [Candidatus Uhrbacteria bacterium RIFCSPHIGHO2_02_FULL_47_29]OGL76008.1 MAG: hypothetical protein A3E96_02125 [Candidatus Uhrbacteria bacterium RIFCSPHIGHO2_12_FULL_46_13]OGL81406.1 MAG: hypothetical protein A2936_00225 [Candidatus Uhrbacteria bacterium RIFCSPLOWO2_01_FULL_47_25]OGL86115.1 MAG: hypothetical protein A3I37_00095 [Candidatus Uhrbact